MGAELVSALTCNFWCEFYAIKLHSLIKTCVCGNYEGKKQHEQWTQNPHTFLFSDRISQLLKYIAAVPTLYHSNFSPAFLSFELALLTALLLFFFFLKTNKIVFPWAYSGAFSRHKLKLLVGFLYKIIKSNQSFKPCNLSCCAFEGASFPCSGKTSRDRPRAFTVEGSSPTQHLISSFHWKLVHVSEHTGELREASSLAREETQTGIIIFCCYSVISHCVTSHLSYTNI